MDPGVQVRNPDPLDRRRFVLSEHSFLVMVVLIAEVVGETSRGGGFLVGS